MVTTSLSSGSSLRLAAPATAAGSAAIALAVYQVAVPGTPSASFDSVLDWVREGLFLIYLLASVAAVVIARRSGLAPAATAALLAIGYGLIATGVAIGMVLRDDPDWFFLLAGPGLLASSAAFVLWAWIGWRSRVLPAYDVLLCLVGGLTAIALAELGTSVLVGAHWLYVAARLRNVSGS
jgi:hypothetical protein